MCRAESPVFRLTWRRFTLDEENWGGDIYLKTILKDRGKRVIFYLVNEFQVAVLCSDVDRGVAHLFLGD